jgi:hypothetical protein
MLTVQTGEAHGPQEEHVLAIDRREKRYRRELIRKLLRDLRCEKVDLAIILFLDNGSRCEPITLIGMYANEPVTVRLAYWHRFQVLFDADCVRIRLIQPEGRQVIEWV